MGVVRMQKKISYFIGILVLVGVAIGGWYNFYYIKTPEYSMKILQEAIQKKDIDTFKKHVDLEEVSSSLVDGYLEAKNKNTKEKDELGDAFVKALKPQISSMLKDEITSKVKNGSWEIEESNKIVNDEVVMADVNLSGVKIKKISYIKNEGDVPHVGIDIDTPALPENYVIDLKLSKNDDGSWKISDVTNFEEYTDKVIKQKKEDLKKYIADTKSYIAENNKKWAEVPRDNRKVAYAKYAELCKERLDKLNELDVPYGAKELNELRKEVALNGYEFYTYVSKEGNTDMFAEMPKEMSDKYYNRREKDKEVREIIRKSEEES